MAETRFQHRRHRRKYAEGELIPEEHFVFRGPAGRLRLAAENLRTFLKMAEGVDEGTGVPPPRVAIEVPQVHAAGVPGGPLHSTGVTEIATGYPGYDTSVGWFQYGDDVVRDNVRRALAAQTVSLAESLQYLLRIPRRPESQFPTCFRRS